MIPNDYALFVVLLLLLLYVWVEQRFGSRLNDIPAMKMSGKNEHGVEIIEHTKPHKVYNNWA